MVLDPTGVAHLFGGEEAMLKEMVRKLAAVGCGSRIAAAPTYGAAYAISHCVANPTFVLDHGKVAEALDLLPVSALRLPREIIAALKKLGFERIGELNTTLRIGKPAPQLLAANVDGVFIVTSIGGHFNLSRMKRYHALVRQSEPLPWSW